MATNSTSVKASAGPRGDSAAAAQSAAVQDYVKAIHAIAERTGEPVSTTALSERLEVSVPSVSAMVKRLDETGLVTHTPYRGVELTGKGREVALETIRHHRLVELFLHEMVGMPWDQVHDEAEVLEHAISERLEDAIARKLGDPMFDPHGDPIPTVDGEVFEQAHVALSSMQVGAAGTFVRISDSDPEMLRFLDEKQVAPGDRLTIISHEPFGGPIIVDFDSVAGRMPIGESLALVMRVAPNDQESSADR